jgi:hypothetical protein
LTFPGVVAPRLIYDLYVALEDEQARVELS